MKIGDLYFSFTNPSFFMLLSLTLFLVLVHFLTKKGGGKSVPNAWQSLVELIYDFVPNLVNEQIGGLSGNVKQQFFPCISVTLTFSLFCNPQGIYSFTVTSHFLITLGLSFSIFIGITIVGFQRNGLHFLSFSLPAGNASVAGGFGMTVFPRLRPVSNLRTSRCTSGTGTVRRVLNNLFRSLGASLSLPLRVGYRS